MSNTEGRPHRFGIRAKLFAAFLGFAGLTLIASAVAWISFISIERSVSRVTDESVPGMVDALDLAKTVAEIAATAPILVASTTTEGLATERATLAADVARFTAITEALDRTGLFDAGERHLSDTAAALVAQLDKLAVSVERRLDLADRRAAASAAMHLAHSHFDETLEPLVDDAVFDLVITGDEVMDDNSAAISSLVDDGVSRIDRLLSINAAVNLIAGLIGEAIAVEDRALLEPIRERFLSAVLAIERNFAELPETPDYAELHGTVDRLLDLGRGPDNLLNAIPSSLPSISAPAPGAIRQRLHQRHEETLLQITPMIDDAAFELVMSTEDLTARSEAAISGLINNNADILNLMLTARADGNLVASLLSDAAVAPDDNHLQPSFERFVAAEARLTGLLERVVDRSFHDGLSRATTALVGFGRGDDGIYALRRAELAENDAGRAALNASRILSQQLGDQVSALVGRAEAASLDASLNSAATIDRAQLILIAITVLGLAGAAVTMFRYVDPRVIRPVGQITTAMTRLADGDTSVDIPGRDRRDEIGEMAQALGVFRDTAIAVQEANLREIEATRQRLADAIESISEGFSLYDADDRLVICNNRYKQMQYPEIRDKILPGVTFENLIRQVVSDGFVLDAQDDPETWIAERLARRRNPGPPHVQRRSNGCYIMVSERRTADGGTVAVYSDITELKQRETELSQKSSELEQLAGQLAKYLSPQVYESIFSGRQEVKLTSERKKLTVFFSDIVDFTPMSETLEPEDLTLLLNEYLTEMAKIALAHGATIDKYVGDAIVIFFGDPETKGVQQDALCCVEMALAMRDKMHELQESWRNRGIERPVDIRIGINTGYCTVGNFGSETRMDYTIIGAGVNLAARLQTAAEQGGILVAHETYALVKDRIHCEPQEPISVKGVSRPVATYRVVDRIDRLGEAGAVIQADQHNLRLEMNAAAMSPSEREAAEAALREALDRLSSTGPRDSTE